MNRRFFWNLWLAAALIVLGGCGQSNDEAKHEEPVVLGPQYSAKSGLLVPEETRQSLGLKIVEVTEAKVPAMFEVQLRVYKAGKAGSLASGMVTADKAQLLKSGQPVRVRRRDGQSVAAKVTGVTEQLHKATGAMEVLLEIPEAPEEFRVGTFLQGAVTLDRSDSVVTIPRSALLECSDGHSVYTVSGEHLVRTPVKAGSAHGDAVEITEGLYAGDQVVLEPVMSLWMTELAAVKGGQACCVEPAKGK